MAEFRKLFYALGVAALLAGVSTTAKAQGINCSQGAGTTPTLVRAESFADLVGDFVLDCTGGTPTALNTVVPSVNISVTLNYNITSKILDSNANAAAGSFSEALLIIDEPNVTPYQTRPLLACGDAAAPFSPTTVGVCQIVSTGVPTSNYDAGTGRGDATCETAVFGCGRPNVFQGRQGVGIQNAGNTNVILFNGVPFDPPGAIPANPDTVRAGHRILRITNIRVNSPLIPGGFLLPDVNMSINIAGNVSVTIANPTQRVANVAPGLQSVGSNTVRSTDSDGALLFGNPLTTFVQCVAETRVPQYRFREGFPSSFKPRGIEHYVANGQAANVLIYSGTTAAVPSNTTAASQNVPGVNYFSESGFVATSLVLTANNPPLGVGTNQNSSGNGAIANSTGIAAAGIATQGTRLALSFSNLPLGMSISVPNIVFLRDSVSNAVTGVAMRTLVTTSGRGDGPFTAPTPTPTIATPGSLAAGEGTQAVFEILFSNPAVQEDLVIPITIRNPANDLASDRPEVNKTGAVAGGFAPFILTNDDAAAWGRAATPSATVGFGNLPVPRFRNTGVPVDLFRVNKCSCNLLFPFVTNYQAAPGQTFDTGIALANTSLTPGASTVASQRFGFATNTSQSGPIQFWFYPVNNEDPPVASKCSNVASPDTCPSPTTGKSVLLPGETLLYVLSSGNLSRGLKGAPGFTGYMIAQASFQYCHAFAYISPLGGLPTTNGMSVGYLALQLDKTNSLPSRTGLPSEVLAH